MAQPITGVEVLAQRPRTGLTKEVFTDASSWSVDSFGALTVLSGTPTDTTIGVANYPTNQWLRVRLVSSSFDDGSGDAQ